LAQLSSLAGPLQNIVVQYVITRYSKQCAWYGWYIGFWWLLMVVDGCWWLLMVHGWVEIRCWWVSFRGDAGLPFARLEKARPRSFVGNHKPRGLGNWCSPNVMPMILDIGLLNVFKNN
jgi:hypothetical protein